MLAPGAAVLVAEPKNVRRNTSAPAGWLGRDVEIGEVEMAQVGADQVWAPGDVAHRGGGDLVAVAFADRGEGSAHFIGVVGSVVA